ncbi:MAG: glycosyltransferase [Anaerolineales bacterium]
MSFFSVVVPMLYGPGIERLIESLERQTIGRAQYEVIIVGMERKERAYTSDLVHFDRTSHPLSPASARNRGAAQAVGDVIAFTDADCVARPNWLAVLADRFADPPVTVIGGGVEFDTHGYWAFADNLSMFHAYMAHLPPGERRQLPSLNLAIRRDVFMQLGGFDENYPRPSG